MAKAYSLFMGLTVLRCLWQLYTCNIGAGCTERPKLCWGHGKHAITNMPPHAGHAIVDVHKPMGHSALEELHHC